MMADLNLALTNPYHLIQSVYNDTSSSSSSLDSISTLFTTLFNPTAAYNQIPTLTANTTTANLPNAGTLVKFRAMVQDTGFGSEVYKALSYDGTVLMYGKEEVQSDHIDVSGPFHSLHRLLHRIHTYTHRSRPRWIKTISI